MISRTSNLWKFINTNVVSGILILFLGLLISEKIIDYFRTKKKRKTLICLAAKELENIPNFKPEGNSRFFRFPIEDYFYREIISSDAFNYKRDEVLLVKLHELCSSIKMFNTMSEQSNQLLFINNQKSRSIFRVGSEELLKEIVNLKEDIADHIFKEYGVEKVSGE